MRVLGLRVVLAAGGILLLGSASAQATVIDFDAVPSSGNPILTTLTTQGFVFTGEHFHTLDNKFAGVVDNGTIFLASEAENDLGRPITMAPATGGAFSLVSFDGAEVFWSGVLHQYIIVTGTIAGGGTISTQFTLDGLGDGLGGIDDFQSFVLGPGWGNLTSVTFDGVLDTEARGGFSLDNIDVGAPIPEPTTLALLGAGLAGLAIRRRRPSSH